MRRLACPLQVHSGSSGSTEEPEEAALVIVVVIVIDGPLRNIQRL